MALLIDSSLWIDFTRASSPPALKQQIAPWLLDASAHLAEPVMFELLRFARPVEAQQLQAQFATLPLLSSPPELWSEAASLGRACRRVGVTALSLDLLIATIALHHQATLVSFDRDFAAMAQVSALKLRQLERAGSPSTPGPSAPLKSDQP
ncbi:MAG: PIN domain nuclease [Cyanobacteria bacterium M_surface_7_m2_040]|nr:PIN domain nuclease [Cyanobacteria bacterium K_Offshore_0m_m2_072]MBM5809307.1 PIN domain nuclease [Cyanobacteria bacterium M_surface_9_m1_291]MBM5827605.1 PIN domain nuclease [Cyanobacteria bacterium M_surface_7_m2_040]